MNRADVVLVGAGIAAMSAAQELHRAGLALTILEKSRGLGGRAATRRVAGIPVDIGAQFFSARSEPFRRQVHDWESRGICFPWSRGFHRSENGLVFPPTDSHPRYACEQGMTALAKAMGEGMAVERQCKALRVSREDGGFLVSCEHKRNFRGKRLILSVPVPQVLDLVSNILPVEWAADLKPVSYSPCFSVVAEITGPVPKWRGLQIDGGCLSWAGADFTKGAVRQPTRYVVLHSSSEFARTHFDLDHDEVGRRLAKAAAEADPKSLRGLVVKDVQRWRFAKVETPLPESGFLRKEGLYFVGDAFGARIESAWLSGLSAAQDILGQIDHVGRP